MMKSQGIRLTALLDSGAAINCISSLVVDRLKLFKYEYDKPTQIGQATTGTNRTVTHYVELPYKLGQFTSKIRLAILPDITQFQVILGLPWMKSVNPLIPNWNTGDMYLTKTHVSGKRITYKCKCVHLYPYITDAHKYLHQIHQVKSN